MSGGSFALRLLAANERLKARIHKKRFVIKDERTLLAVKIAYFVVPIALGTAVMKWTGAEQRALAAQREIATQRERGLETDETQEPKEDTLSTLKAR